jgi:DNA-binding HxlR family transcriptional regulator
MLALNALSGGPVRFGELRRRIEGVSQKMLTQTLRNLERDGLILRTLLDDRPLKVEYQLTARGLGLLPISQALKAWAERHLKSIEAANADYDRRHNSPGP